MTIPKYFIHDYFGTDDACLDYRDVEEILEDREDMHTGEFVIYAGDHPGKVSLSSMFTDREDALDALYELYCMEGNSLAEKCKYWCNAIPDSFDSYREATEYTNDELDCTIADCHELYTDLVPLITGRENLLNTIGDLSPNDEIPADLSQLCYDFLDIWCNWSKKFKPCNYGLLVNCYDYCLITKDGKVVSLSLIH